MTTIICAHLHTNSTYLTFSNSYFLNTIATSILLLRTLITLYRKRQLELEVSLALKVMATIIRSDHTLLKRIIKDRVLIGKSNKLRGSLLILLIMSLITMLMITL